MSSTKFSQCICRNADCYLVQTQLWQHHNASKSLNGGTTNDQDVWCQPTPIRFTFDPMTANYKMWLFTLCLCRHIVGFESILVKRLFDSNADQTNSTSMVFSINRIHFPRVLLEQSKSHTTPFPLDVAKKLASIDGSKRIKEQINRASSLDLFGARILPEAARLLFQNSKQNSRFDTFFVFSACVSPNEAKQFATVYIETVSGRKASISRNTRTTPATNMKRPPSAPSADFVTPSVERPITRRRINHDEEVEENDQYDYYLPLHSIDVPQSPSILTVSDSYDATTMISDLTNDVYSPPRTQNQNDVDMVSSPPRNIATVEQCQETIKRGYHRKSANFSLALRALRILHHRLPNAKDPILVQDNNKGKVWIFPCTSKDEDCIAFKEEHRKQSFGERPPTLRLGTALCPSCSQKARQAYKNENKKVSSNKRKQTDAPRLSPATTMDESGLHSTIKTLQARSKVRRRAVVRLKQRIKKCQLKDIQSISDAVIAVKRAYKFLSEHKAKATNVIVEAIIDMETSKKILPWKQRDRKRYADVIVSDIANACHTFNGEKHKIRIHPIMANFAMNLYNGMKYDDATDLSPFMFPTVRSIRRKRAMIATHEGTDPKVYARVRIMDAFKQPGDKLIHWVFDEVKLTSGLMWNAKNDDLRGLCCGVTGSKEELKDLLQDMMDDDDNKEDNQGIYCNQWLARNPFGATLLGEFFYNRGDLDGNEVMRQFLQVSTSAALVKLETVGLVSDMGGPNERFYRNLMDGRTIPPDNLWPTDCVETRSPVHPDVKLHTWSCSTHGAKNIRSQLEKSQQNGYGTRFFHTGDGVQFGWWLTVQALERDKSHHGNMRSSLTPGSVDLDSFSKMNVSLAKQPFSEKTLSEMIDHCCTAIGIPRLILPRDQSIGSGERLKRMLKLMKTTIAPFSIQRTRQIQSEVAYLEFGISVHRVYIQRFMNRAWVLNKDNVDEEEAQLRDALQFFEEWRTNVAELQKDNVSVTRKERERLFISLKTYKNMKFGICGFFRYARDMLFNHPDAHIRYIPAGHSNTSALESRFSISKRNGHNDTTKFHHFVATSNSLASMKHQLKKDKKCEKKARKGNKSYSADLIPDETPQADDHDIAFGKLMQARKKAVKQLLVDSPENDRKIAAIPQTILPEASWGFSPKTDVCKKLLPRLQREAVPEGSYTEMLRQNEVIQDLMILTIEEGSESWKSLKMLLSTSEAKCWDIECLYLVQLAFQLIDETIKAGKLSHRSSYWWHVMNRMRDGTVHSNSPNPQLSQDVRSYIFQFLSGQLWVWSKETLKADREENEVAIAGRTDPKSDGWKLDEDAVGRDLNIFVGYSLFSLKKKYGNSQELEPGDENEDKHWLLTDIVAKEEDIENNEEYMSKYYDQYYSILNRGGMTLVSPRFAGFFHRILVEITRYLNTKKMREEKDQWMKLSRQRIERDLPVWSRELQSLAEGVHMINPEKACKELLEEIVRKTFNSQGNAVLKRYYAFFLARGGKESSRSTLRESRKQEGIERRKKQKTGQEGQSNSSPEV